MISHLDKKQLPLLSCVCIYVYVIYIYAHPPQPGPTFFPITLTVSTSEVNHLLSAICQKTRWAREPKSKTAHSTIFLKILWCVLCTKST